MYNTFTRQEDSFCGQNSFSLLALVFRTRHLPTNTAHGAVARYLDSTGIWESVFYRCTVSPAGCCCKSKALAISLVHRLKGQKSNATTSRHFALSFMFSEAPACLLIRIWPWIRASGFCISGAGCPRHVSCYGYPQLWGASPRTAETICSHVSQASAPNQWSPALRPGCGHGRSQPVFYDCCVGLQFRNGGNGSRETAAAVGVERDNGFAG